MYLFLVFVSCAAAYHHTENVFCLGGLFESSEIEKEMVFKYATERLNEKSDTTSAYNGITRYTSLVKRVPHFDSFKVSKSVCELLGQGVAGVFGPQSVDTTDHVQSLCDTKEVPHVEQRWDIRQRRGSCLVNLHPHPSSIAKALADIVKAFKWGSFTIIYDQQENLIKVKDLLSFYDHKGYPVTVRALEGENYRPLLRRIKNTGQTNIVLDCASDKLYDVMMQALQVGLMGTEYNYIITTLDMHSVNLDTFVYCGTNITGIRLIDPEDTVVKDAVKYLNQKRSMSREGHNLSPFNERTLKHDTALIMDSVTLFAKSLHQLSRSKEIHMRALNCSGKDSWEHGYSLINYMKMSEFEGVTGLVKFDHEGFRTDFRLEILDLTQEGLRRTATWNMTEGVNFTQLTYSDDDISDSHDLRNMSFIVMIALTHPYGMLKETAVKLSGNDRYEGMGIDVIQELAALHGFNYTFRVQADGSSGNPDKNGKWNGMIGEVLAGRADLAIADITITREREKDADFTLPFLDLGISILYKKPMKMAPNLFSFLLPFSSQVWYATIAAYLGVSLLLFVIARITPREWTNPYPCIEEPRQLENQFSLNNSLWFTLGSIMQQGSEIAPIAVSTRMVAGIWWFFTLIMVSSYTANLAAFLTFESTHPKFRTVEDLANQKPVVIKYGLKAGGATGNFFRDSNHSTYTKMWQFMQENQDVLVATNEEGVARVMSTTEDFAFLMESTSISYEVQRKCELTQVGGLLDSKGYGIAMRKNSWYRSILSTSIVQLQEKGKLRLLYDKWWKEKRGGGACHDDDNGGDAAELDLDNVGGVFVVLLIGASFACFIALIELMWEIYKKEDKASFWGELKEELKFIVSCQGSVKPVKKGNRTEETTSTDNADPFSNSFNKYHSTETKHPLD